MEDSNIGLEETFIQEEQRKGGTAAKPETWSKRKIILAITLYSLTVGCLLGPFSVVENMQSSLNFTDGMGTSSLAVLYSSVLVGQLFFAKSIMTKLTPKWTLLMSVILYSTYTMANLYPSFWTLTLSGILVGFAAAPMWLAGYTSAIRLGQYYANVSTLKKTHAITCFNSVFVNISNIAVVIGAVLFHVVFHKVTHTDLGEDSYNISSSSQELNCSGVNETMLSGDVDNACGCNFCPRDSVYNNRMLTPPEHVLKTFLWVCLGCSGFALMLALCLPTVADTDISSPANNSLPHGLIETIWFHKNMQAVLIIPLALYEGYMEIIIITEYRQVGE